ncbi:hypothetical protein RUM43_002981 [Polyplax serrata]|uniref:Uncharacterized protein n=1 Tax=Polyplax serrata TaxID=468196 RepID=A0AAN8NZG8_POLSC
MIDFKLSTCKEELLGNKFRTNELRKFVCCDAFPRGQEPYERKKNRELSLKTRNQRAASLRMKGQSIGENQTSGLDSLLPPADPPKKSNWQVIEHFATDCSTHSPNLIAVSTSTTYEQQFENYCEVSLFRAVVSAPERSTLDFNFYDDSHELLGEVKTLDPGE